MGLVLTLPLILPLHSAPIYHCLVLFFFFSLLSSYASGRPNWKLAGGVDCFDASRLRGQSRRRCGGCSGHVNQPRLRFSLPYNCILRQLLPHHAPTATITSTNDSRRALWPCTAPRSRSSTPRFFSHRSVCLDSVEAHCTSGAV